MLSKRVLTGVQVTFAVAAALAMMLAVVPAQAETAATTAVLQLMPDSAQVSVVIPPLGKTVERGTALAKKLAPEDVDIDAELEKIIADMAKDAGVEGATDLQAIADAKGVDLNAPLAVFFDFSASVKIEEGSGDTDADADANGDADVDAVDDENGDDEEGDNDNVGDDDGPDVELKEPNWVLVVGVSDQEKALASLNDLVNDVPSLSKEEAREIPAGDQTIHARGDMGYIMLEGKVAVGSVEMLKSVAARVNDPAEVRYGTEAVPAGSDTEVAALIYGKRLLPILEAAAPTLEQDEDYAALIKMQLESLRSMFGEGSSEDPLLVTYTLEDDKVTLASKIDTATHPGVLTYSGKAHPLRLAPMLPVDTLAFTSIRFNDEMRKQLTETILPAIADASGGKTEQAMGFLPQVLELIGEEISLGISSKENDFPAIVLMLALKEPESAKSFIKIMAGQYLMPGETHNEVEINSIAAPSPIPISVAMPDDLIVISNNVEAIKSIIDLNKAGGKTDLFEKMTPALSSNTPRYLALLVQSKLLSDVVIPLSALAGGLPDDFAPVANVASQNVQEVRFLNEMDGTWSTSSFQIILK